MYINLIDQISEDDKKRIENYIHSYGTVDRFIGIDNWLQNWSHANQKLFKLLGGQLIVKKKVEIKKSDDLLKEQFNDLLLNSRFINLLTDARELYNCRRRDDLKIGYYDVCDKDFFYLGGMHKVFCECCDHPRTYLNDKIENKAKVVGPYTGKTYQIQQGMKPIRAIKKIVEFFVNELSDEKSKCITELERSFEDFRIAASMILNDKIMRGNLCVSIHPLDYMTMSDNSSNWSSCMSWTSDGCYRVGTVEMMNSNNALCCYLEGADKFCFSRDAVKITSSESDVSMNEELRRKVKEIVKRDGELYEWNNKKWRVLVYANKDIIMTGKSYPYYSESVDKDLLAFVVELAKKNMNWHYQFGPERYQDMIHVYTATAMNNNRKWIKYGRTTKHNILWDTHGMYNDMLNANKYKYWCYRNAVDHNKIYSVSGKSVCLCCGNEVASLEWPNDRDYNSRYDHTGAVICKDCIDRYYYCDSCASSDTTLKYYYVEINGEVKRYCQKCIDSLFCYCPCCGTPMFVLPNDEYGNNRIRYPLWLPKQEKDMYRFPTLPTRGHYMDWQPMAVSEDKYKDDGGYEYAQALMFCEDCLKEQKKFLKREKQWMYSGFAFSKDQYDVAVMRKGDCDDFNQFCFRGLTHVPIEKIAAGTEARPFKASAVGLLPQSEIEALPWGERKEAPKTPYLFF